MLIKHADRLEMAGLLWIVASLSSQVVQASVQDVSTNKTASQSSTSSMNGITGVPELSIDGNLYQYYHGQSCQGTDKEIYPYWEVDLGKIYSIHHIVVYNRVDPCCSYLTHHLRIEVSEAGHNYRTVCYHLSQIPDIYTCQPQHVLLGRFVKLSLYSGQLIALSVCEVKVMADIQSENEKGNRFLYIPSVKGTGDVLMSSTVASSATCTYKCHLHTLCLGINLVNRKTHLECNLLSTAFYQDTMEADVSFWTVYV